MKLSAFSTIATGGRINAATGVIHGVSVITEGEAEGHDLWIDEATITKLKELCKGSVKVKINHPKKGESPPFQSTAGNLENFYIDGRQLRADLHLLKSDEFYDKIVEMSEKMPEDFGLSVRIEQEVEKKDGKEFCRPLSIESVDLVDAPAANPNGLFSKPADMEGYCNCGKDGCKKCADYAKKLSEKNKKEKSMSAIIAKALGLSADASEETIALELTKKLDANKPQDLTALEKKVKDAETTLSELQRKGIEQVSLAKKNEIDALMAEAARDGKVVPLDNDDLYTTKDSVHSIHTEPTQLAKMISKLPKGAVALAKKSSIAVPKNGKGEEFNRRTPEGDENMKEFCRQAQANGAEQLTQLIRGNN